GLDVTLTMSTLQWVMTLVVAGVGALVLAYCAAYFRDDEPGRGLLAGTLTAFAGAMLGLVWSDNLLITYVLSELRPTFSFLLFGYEPPTRSARAAALQAVIVTPFGGRAMLVVILMIVSLGGTYAVSELLASPPEA